MTDSDDVVTLARARLASGLHVSDIDVSRLLATIDLWKERHANECAAWMTLKTERDYERQRAEAAERDVQRLRERVAEFETAVALMKGKRDQ